MPEENSQLNTDQITTLGKISKLMKKLDKQGQPPKEKKPLDPEKKQALLDRLAKGREAKAKSAPAPSAKPVPKKLTKTK